MATDSKLIRILVVDDHFMVRMGLCASLNVEPDVKVVAEAANSEEALQAYRQHRPSLVLMDVRLPGVSGIETTAAMLGEFPGARILMLSTHSGEEEIYRSLQTGAAGYIVKSALRENLLAAIRVVSRGERYVDPSVASLLAARLSHRSLTARELEVLQLVAKGMSNKEIAVALNITEVTVKLHVSHILEKLNVKDRAQAVAEALKRGVIAS
ncbi:MAG TPA: response regulator transcription factor [Candidatus Angelobacter sp.]|nr:response regulator transcription factor [Candidatus Angelobacter sp.]